MSETNYEQLNRTAYECSPAAFKTLLLTFGDDKNAMLAITYAVDGETIEGIAYRGPVPFKEEKQAALADYKAAKNEFDPNSVESRLASEYNKMAARLATLEKENNQLKRDLAVEKAKSKPNEFPGIH